MNTNLLTETQAAQWLNLKPSTLRRWRWAGSGPEFIRVGKRAIRYRMAALESFTSNGRSN